MKQTERDTIDVVAYLKNQDEEKDKQASCLSLQAKYFSVKIIILCTLCLNIDSSKQ